VSAPVTRTILDGGINWNWYLNATFDEANQLVTIHFYGRFHKYDDARHPKAEALRADRMWIIEAPGAERIAASVMLERVEYTVTNPAYVFSYRDASRLEMES